MDPERRGVFLVERANEPPGWALPGGFIEYGEDPGESAVREGREETGLDIELLGQFRTYGAPGRDPRFHTITVVYVATGRGTPVAADDAKNVRFFRWEEIPELAFDHSRIIEDYRKGSR
jgi:ADP-ribose pyrophosphatase YjhB (NUDIX family)